MTGLWEWACSTVGHQRSRSRARRYGETVLSRCRRCGARMVRLGEGNWDLISPEDEAFVMRTGQLPQSQVDRAA